MWAGLSLDKRVKGTSEEQPRAFAAAEQLKNLVADLRALPVSRLSAGAAGPYYLLSKQFPALLIHAKRGEEMAQKTLQDVRVAIVATDGFEQAELMEPRKPLEEAGARTSVISPKAGTIQGFKHDEKADKVHVDLTLASAKASDFDAVLLPGGALNADALRIEPKAQEFVREIDQAKKPIAVICHGPWLLVSAKLTKGRKLTSYHTIQEDIRNAGAEWTDQAVVTDRNWISSRQPADIPAFNRAIIDLLDARSHAGKSKTQGAV
jgi:protease I